MRQQPINDVGQDNRDAPHNEEDVVRNARDWHHSPELKSKPRDKQEVSDGQPNFENLPTHNSQHKHRRQPRSVVARYGKSSYAARMTDAVSGRWRAY
jgi:hypothetical protein